MQRYDVPTAITFLFAGLGLGAALAILFAPRPEQQLGDDGGIATGLRALDDAQQAFASRAV
jgi:hypothetical protein